jgi:hypothetical protein
MQLISISLKTSQYPRRGPTAFTKTIELLRTREVAIRPI